MFLLGNFPANVDFKAGVWGRWETVCWQEVPLTSSSGKEKIKWRQLVEKAFLVDSGTNKGTLTVIFSASKPYWHGCTLFYSSTQYFLIQSNKNVSDHLNNFKGHWQGYVFRNMGIISLKCISAWNSWVFNLRHFLKMHRRKPNVYAFNNWSAVMGIKFLVFVKLV